MYAAYFGLKELPFSIAPNPAYLYLGQKHRDALAHLLYGVRGDSGVILLTGEVGTGKTTLCRRLLEEAPKDVETAFILNPRLTEVELLTSVCEEFGIARPQKPTLKTLVDRLNRHLLAANARNRRCLLIIDEAQNLSEAVLEQLRLLTNLETNTRKLLQIILLGQPELLRTLGRPGLRQLNQRITARYHLRELGRQDTASYIRHRLAVAGSHAALFSPGALRLVHRLSGGIPRLINLVCDRALLGAFAHDRQGVDWWTLARAAREALGRRRSFRLALAAAMAALLACLGAGLLYWQLSGQAELAAPRPPASQTVQLPLDGHPQPEAAYHDLFALWGLSFADRQSPPCELAARVGLGCHSLDAGLPALLALDRPAVLRLASAWFTLSRAEAEALTLIAGKRQFQMAQRDFLAEWDGKAYLLWQTPPAWPAPLQLNDRGEAALYLRARLAKAAGQARPAQPGLAFDESARQQLKDFQASVGLAPTGAPDAPTWIHLNSLFGDSLPSLEPREPGS